MPDTWTRKTAAELLETAENRIKFFTEYRGTGIITPAKRGVGKGSTTFYNEDNLIELGIAVQMSLYGIHISKIDEALKFLREPLVKSKVVLPKSFKRFKKYQMGFLDQLKANNEQLYLAIEPRQDGTLRLSVPNYFDRGIMERESILIIDLRAIYNKVLS